RPLAGVAGARALLVDHEEQRVAIAVVVRLPDPLPVPRRLALAPVLLPATGPEPGAAGLEGLAERSVVHVGEHEDRTGPRVLDDRRDEPVGVVLHPGQMLRRRGDRSGGERGGHAAIVVARFRRPGSGTVTGTAGHGAGAPML